MKLIYVAGKYSGKDYDEIDLNINTARSAAIKLLAKRWAVITPHLNTYHMEDVEHHIGFKHGDWLKMDLVILERCDAIFMLRGWEDSKGATMEHNFAKEQGLKIYYEEDGYPNEGGN
jgi:hypothetical protein